MNTYLLILSFLIIYLIYSSVKIIPQRKAYIVERFGKYTNTLLAGLNIIVPFIDKIRYRQTLKEQAIDVDSQVCITKDNISVEVDGILYLQVIDPKKSSYGIDNYRFASIQMAQTTMRSIIGKLELDKTFEERESINNAIVEAVDKASDPWGVKVTRYELKNITPPQSIKDAMEKQMRAEREKRAVIAQSEGHRQSKINTAVGEREQLISVSEGEKIKRINEAEGKSAEILTVAKATAEGIRIVANSLEEKGGQQAMNLKIAEQYIKEFGKLAQSTNSLIIPSNLSDISGMVAGLSTVFKKSQEENKKNIRK